MFYRPPEGYFNIYERNCIDVKDGVSSIKIINDNYHYWVIEDTSMKRYQFDRNFLTSLELSNISLMPIFTCYGYGGGTGWFPYHKNVYYKEKYCVDFVKVLNDDIKQITEIKSLLDDFFVQSNSNSTLYKGKRLRKYISHREFYPIAYIPN